MTGNDNKQLTKTQIRKAFNSAADALAVHRAIINIALQHYRNVSKAAAETYQPALAKEKIHEAKQAALKTIRDADAEMSHKVKTQAEVLRSELHRIISKPVPIEFERSMRLYRDFGLQMSESEVRAFADSAFENYPAVRVLAAVADHSGYRVSMPAVKEAEADLHAIEAAARIPSLYASEGHIQEALALYDETPVFRKDGSIAYSRGKPDAVTIQMFSSAKDALEKRLTEEMPQRWERMQPIIEQIDPKEYVSRSEAEKAQRDAEHRVKSDFIETLGIDLETETQVKLQAAQQAETNRQAAAVIAHYK